MVQDDDIKQLIEEFMNSSLFKKKIDKIDDGNVYNEFSLQHELGIFLRKNLEKEGTKSKVPPYFEIAKKRQIKWNQIKDTSFHYYLLEI